MLKKEEIDIIHTTGTLVCMKRTNVVLDEKLIESMSKNSISSPARGLRVQNPFPPIKIPSGYSSGRKPYFASQTPLRRFESELLDTL